VFSKSILLLSVAALVLPEPIPQADVSSELASAVSVLASVLSGAPTLPSFVESVLKTVILLSAFPTGTGCQTTTPAWYYSLPADVKSALSSHDLAFESWYLEHTSVFAGDSAMTLPFNICADAAPGTAYASETGASALPTVTGATPTETGTLATFTGKTVAGCDGVKEWKWNFWNWDSWFFDLRRFRWIVLIFKGCGSSCYRGYWG